MPDLPRILVFGGKNEQAESLTAALAGRFIPVRASGMEEALQLLRNAEFAGLCLLDSNVENLCAASLLPQAGGLLSQVPDGLAILDVRLKILWANRRFQELAGSPQPPIGIGFYDAFGAPEPDRAWSRRLGGAAMELLWALAADAPAVLIEANFRPYSERERAKLASLAARPVEVHCACPPELALKRYNARVTHPVHVVTTLQLEAMAEYDRPVGIGALVTVDTTVPVDVTAVAAAVRMAHEC